MIDQSKRERKVDIEKMSGEQADLIGKQIGEAMAKIMDEANRKCNEILNIYGMQTQIQYQIVPLVKNEAQVVENVQENKKKGRKSKKAVKEQSLTLERS